MPYVTQQKRIELDDITSRIKLAIDENRLTCAGDMNYLTTLMVNYFIQKRGLNYANCNEVMGFFSCAEKEFYRRTIIPLENEKIASNGDV